VKIAFVTSCLEPGCDGVGDYATGLAEESARRGHIVARVALNDPFGQADGANGLLRMGGGVPWPERAARARSWLSDFAPDWISLHFVCYGFHPRGFVGGVAPHLLRALEGWPLEVFFHEHWLGEETGARWRDRIIGWKQRRDVLAFLRNSKPKLVHTTNPAYVHLLSQRGVKASRIPLCGPLPEAPPAPPRKTGKLTFALFGTLHPIWPPEPLLTQLGRLADQVTLAHVGRMGAGEALWAQMERTYGGKISFLRLGELPPERIAAFFTEADYGIATTPWTLMGKSASAAAMLDAGLPVIVNRDDIHFRGMPEAPADHSLLIRMSDDLPGQLATVRRRPSQPRLPEVTSLFLEQLENG
jgi:hypothetical protein